MVNHYLLSNEELISRLVNLVEELAHVEFDEFDYDNYDVIFGHKHSKEFNDIRQELLERMTK